MKDHSSMPDDTDYTTPSNITPFRRIVQPGSREAFQRLMHSIAPALDADGQPYTVDEPDNNRAAFKICQTCKQETDGLTVHGTTVITRRVIGANGAVTIQRTNKTQPCPTCSPAVIKAKARAIVTEKIKRLVTFHTFKNMFNLPAAAASLTMEGYPIQGDQKAKEKVQEFIDGEFPNIFLTGNPGLGKTGLATAAAWKMLEKGKQIFSISMSQYITLLKENFNNTQEANNEIEYIVKNVEVLFLDDLGTEGATEFTLKSFQEVIQAREDLGLKTCISSNLDLEGLRTYWTFPNVSFQPGLRTIDRLDGWYTLVKFTGKSIRKG